MKKCPTCKRTFEDTFTFCLKDGSVLNPPLDPEATLLIHAKDTNLPAAAAPFMIPYRKGNKWGFCDSNRRMVIPLRYDWVDRFSEGSAGVGLQGKCGFIDRNGRVVIPLKYDAPWDFIEYSLTDYPEMKFSEGLASVASKGRIFGVKCCFIEKSVKEVIIDKNDR